MTFAGRSALVHQRGQPATLGAASTTLDIAFSLMSAALVSVTCIPLLLLDGNLGEFGSLVSSGAVAVLAIGLVGLHPRVSRRMLRLGGRVLPPWAIELASVPRSYRVTLLILLAETVCRLVSALAFFTVVRSVYPLGLELLPVLAGISAAGYIVGVMVPLAPAGLGAREGLVAILLATLMPAPTAVLISVLDRGVSIVADLVAAGLALVLARGARRAGAVSSVPVAGATAARLLQPPTR